MLSLGFLLYFGFCYATLVSARVHWNDPNIVSIQNQWVQVDINKVSGNPHPPVDDKWQRNDSSIVVLIAALRETRLPDTLLSMFDNAAFPSRIHVAVVQQNAVEDEDVVSAFCKRRGAPVTFDERTSKYINSNNCPEFDRIRMLRMDVSEAAGPVYARARQAELVTENDDFCFQIDAHTIFIKEWDLRILREWGMTKNEYAVLTTYPTNYKHLYENSNNHWEMPHLCDATVHRGIVHNSQAKAAANLERPLLSPLWAAGMSFSRCHAERNVPNDINLMHIFTGEEYARGVRLWTHGYDFYSVTRPIIGTYYGGEKGGKGGWRSNSALASLSTERIRTLVQAEGSDQSERAKAALGRYALGHARTLDQYIEFSGLDPRKGTSNMKCIVEYVPWNTMAPVLTEPLATNLRPSVLQENDITHVGLSEKRSLFLLPSVIIIFLVLGYCCRLQTCNRKKTVWEKNLLKIRRNPRQSSKLWN